MTDVVQDVPQEEPAADTQGSSPAVEEAGTWKNCTPDKSFTGDVENPKDVFVPTDLDKGLDDAQVEVQRAKFGSNEIPVPCTPMYVLFLRQFIGFLPMLIQLAALISLAVQDYTDFGIIVGMLVINASLGFREEYHAKKSLDEVSNQLESEIAVRRNNGQTKPMPTKELVPGVSCYSWVGPSSQPMSSGSVVTRCKSTRPP